MATSKFTLNRVSNDFCVSWQSLLLSFLLQYPRIVFLFFPAFLNFDLPVKITDYLHKQNQSFKEQRNGTFSRILICISTWQQFGLYFSYHILLLKAKYQWWQFFSCQLRSKILYSLIIPGQVDWRHLAYQTCQYWVHCISPMLHLLCMHKGVLKAHSQIIQNHGFSWHKIADFLWL